MPTSFNINSDELVGLTNKLEKLTKSAMPLAVRGTLNDAAFYTKQNTIPKFFSQNFTERKRGFIRSHTAANKSPNTFDINKMQSSAGVIKGKSGAGDLLDKQEYGGTIKNREHIPTTEVRISKSERKLVTKRLYYKKFKNSKNGVVFKSKRITLIKTEKALFSVSKGGKWKTLYILNEDAKIGAAPFVAPAGIETSRKIPDLFLKNAKKRFEKFYNK